MNDGIDFLTLPAPGSLTFIYFLKCSMPTSKVFRYAALFPSLMAQLVSTLLGISTQSQLPQTSLPHRSAPLSYIFRISIYLSFITLVTVVTTELCMWFFSLPFFLIYFFILIMSIFPTSP